jgi:DNA-directed RNA polymerase specialized sigma24 family protein
MPSTPSPQMVPSATTNFPATRWTLIQRVRGVDEKERSEALEQLCKAYWMPLYAFARRTGLDPHESEDAVQGFILYLLQDDVFSSADHNQGRLRSLLGIAFSRYLGKAKRHGNSQRRGGKLPHLPFLPPDAEGQYQLEVASLEGSPDQIYHRKWAENLIQRTIERLQSQCAQKGQAERFSVLRTYLPWNGKDESTAAQGAAAAGMTPGAFRTALHRLRHQYREIVIAEVSETIGSSDPEEIENEIRDLFQTLSH